MQERRERLPSSVQRTPIAARAYRITGILRCARFSSGLVQLLRALHREHGEVERALAAESLTCPHPDRCFLRDFDLTFGAQRRNCELPTRDE